MSVTTRPGATELIRTPCGAYSNAADRVSAIAAGLAWKAVSVRASASVTACRAVYIAVTSWPMPSTLRR